MNQAFYDKQLILGVRDSICTLTLNCSVLLGNMQLPGHGRHRSSTETVILVGEGSGIVLAHYTVKNG